MSNSNKTKSRNLGANDSFSHISKNIKTNSRIDPGIDVEALPFNDKAKKYAKSADDDFRTELPSDDEIGFDS